MKFKSFLIPLVVSSLFLVGCNNNDNNDKPVTDDDKVTEEITPTPTPEPEVEPTAEEVLVSLKESEYAYSGNTTTISIDEEKENIVLFDENNNEIPADKANKILKDEVFGAPTFYNDKKVDIYDAKNNSIFSEFYDYDDEKFIYKKNNKSSYLFTKDNIEYKIIKNGLPGSETYDYYKLSNGHIKNMAITSLYKVVENAMYMDLSNLEQAAKNLKDQLEPEINLPLNINIESSKVDDLYIVSLVASVKNAPTEGVIMNEMNFKMSIKFNKEYVKEIEMNNSFNVLVGNLFINKKLYKVCNLNEMKSNIILKRSLDDSVVVPDGCINNAKEITSKPLSIDYDGISFINLGLKYNDYVSYSSDPDKMIPEDLKNLKNVQIKYYTDKDLKNEINSSDIEFKTYDQNIYFDLIVNDGYALVYEYIDGIGYDSDYSFSEYKISDTPKYVYKTKWSENVSKPEYQNLMFTTILLNGNPVEEETELVLENKKVYNVYYSIDIDSISGSGPM